MSMCSLHGSYSADNLCPCYDKGGSHEGVTYGDQPFSYEAAKLIMAACPIHGSYTPPDDLCPCYNENGDLKEDWDKDLN